MQIAERLEGNILVLSVDGRLDYAGAGKFQEFTIRKICEGARSIVVDFGGTTFLASMGIRALMVPAQEMMKAGGRFAITGLSADLKKLFETAGLFQLFKVYPSLAEAAADGDWP